MGYTHYWTRSRLDISKADWKDITDDVRKIVALSPAPLAWEYDQTNKPVQIDDTIIRFNGVADDGHETFYIERVIKDRKPRYEGDDPKWTFCKTAQKPYDVTVTAILAYLDSCWPHLFRVTSDGEPAEWREGVELARKALGDKIAILSITHPRGVHEYERTAR